MRERERESSFSILPTHAFLSVRTPTCNACVRTFFVSLLIFKCSSIVFQIWRKPCHRPPLPSFLSFFPPMMDEQRERRRKGEEKHKGRGIAPSPMPIGYIRYPIDNRHIHSPPRLVGGCYSYLTLTNHQYKTWAWYAVAFYLFGISVVCTCTHE